LVQAINSVSGAVTNRSSATEAKNVGTTLIMFIGWKAYFGPKTLIMFIEIGGLNRDISISGLTPRTAA
jgi:hypothetical protein